MTNKLGIIQGKMLLFGGVYSNLQALQSLKSIAVDEGVSPSNIICTGDVVGYCAQPEETVNTIRDWGIHSIIGNVEEQLREGGNDCGCEYEEGGRCASFAANWYPYAQIHLSDSSIAWMRSLPNHITFEYGGQQAFVVHGSYHHISEYIFRSTEWPTKQKNFEDTSADLIIAGHCGLPFHHQDNNKLWLNPGVIGMPANDGTERVWYAILEEKGGKLHFEHRSFTFNGDYTHDLMLRKHLPEEYAETLLTGLWDNNEILPDLETSQQGLALEF